jgi:hypothetical protein
MSKKSKMRRRLGGRDRMKKKKVGEVGVDKGLEFV